MNWNRGIKRICALSIGAFSLLFVWLYIFDFSSIKLVERFVGVAFAVIGGLVAYRVACWIIDGFSTKP